MQLTSCSGLEGEGSLLSLADRCCVFMALLCPAIQAVRGMVEAPDFDRKMLLLATQLANESDMKTLLLAVLEALLDTIQKQDGHQLHTEALTLIRCIIRLTVKLMAEPGVNRCVRN